MKATKYFLKSIKKIFSFLLLTVAFFFLPPLGRVGVGLFAQDYKLKLGSVIPKDSPWEEGVNEWIKMVDQRSGGKAKIKTYLGGQLGGEVEMIKSIAMGTLEAGAFTTAAIAEALSLPQLQVFELPFLFNSDEEADFVMDAMFVNMSQLMASKGLVMVMWGTNGWRSFGTKMKPVIKPADIKGLKMRSQESEVYINFYKTLGATPVPISTPDVLVSLKTGMVDGYDQTPIFSVSTGWVTACKHFSLTKHIYQPGAIVISKRFFDKLPDNIKSAILCADSRAELQKKSRSLVRTDDNEVLNTCESNFNVKITKLTEQQRDEFKKAVQPVYTTMESKITKAVMQQVSGELVKYKTVKK